MILRDFASCRETVDDIKNITEKRRYILIFKYDNPIHFGLNYCYDNLAGNYDLYLINESTVHGNNFYIPHGITLMQRNHYRGSVREPIIDGDKINQNSDIIFYHGSFTNRIHQDNGEIFRLSSPTVMESCGGPGYTTIEDEFKYLLKSECIQPFPEFYNIEDQAVFDNKHTGRYVGDFWYDYNEVPSYKLRDLIDPYTRIAIIDMPDMNALIKLSLADSIASENYLCEDADPNIKFNNGLTVELESFKEKLTWCFIKLNQYLMDSVFSQADIIIDTEDGTFNILNESLRVKFRELNKKDIMDDLTLLVSKVSELVDDQFGEIDDTPSEIYKNNLCPNRVYVHISNTGCKMKVSNTYKLALNKHNGQINPIFATSESSASDTDEIVSIQCSDLGILWGKENDN